VVKKISFQVFVIIASKIDRFSKCIIQPAILRSKSIIIKDPNTHGRRFYVVEGWTCPPPRFTCCLPQIQKLADHSDVTSVVPKGSKIKVFRWGSLQRSPDPLAVGEGARCPCQEPHPRSRPFGPCFYGSQGPTHYRVGNPANDRFQMYAYMKFVFFSVSENGENGHCPSRISGLEPPLQTVTHLKHFGTPSPFIR